MSVDPVGTSHSEHLNTNFTSQTAPGAANALRKALRLPIGANYHGHKADEELSGWQVAKTLVDGRLG